MPTTAHNPKLNAQQISLLQRLLSLSATKQERFMKLAKLYEASYDEEEKQEIWGVLAEVLFPNSDDLTPEPLDDSNEESKEAKKRLRTHREYVAAQIAKQRMQRGWTQEKLSEAAGLPQSHISRLEKCVHAPTCLTLKKVADALGIDPGLLDPNYESVSDEDE